MYKIDSVFANIKSISWILYSILVSRINQSATCLMLNTYKKGKKLKTKNIFHYRAQSKIKWWMKRGGDGCTSK